MRTRDLRITLCRTCAVRASESARLTVVGVESARCNEAADFARRKKNFGKLSLKDQDSESKLFTIHKERLSKSDRFKTFQSACIDKSSVH